MSRVKLSLYKTIFVIIFKGSEEIEILFPTPSTDTPAQSHPSPDPAGFHLPE
jgi:hypothetical protein